MDTGKEILRCTNELKVPDSDIDFWPNLFNKIGSPRGIPRYLHKLLPESTQLCTETPRKRLNAGALHFPGYFCLLENDYSDHYRRQLHRVLDLVHG